MNEQTAKRLNSTQALMSDIQSIRHSYTTPKADIQKVIPDVAERIATALYLVTAHLSDREQLRIQIRDQAIALMSLSGQLGGGDSDRYTTIGNIIDSVEQAMAFMRLARVSRLISEVNSLMIEREASRLHRYVVSEYIKSANPDDYNMVRDGYDLQSRLADVLQTTNDTMVQTNTPNRNDIQTRREKRDKGQSVQVDFAHESSRVAPESGDDNDTLVGMLSDAIARTHIDIVDAGISDRSGTRHPFARPIQPDDVDAIESDDQESLGPEERKKEIVNYLRGSGIVTINDIIDNIPGYSIKTMQRSLQDLIESGAIRKIGQKRWAKYEAVA